MAELLAKTDRGTYAIELTKDELIHIHACLVDVDISGTFYGDEDEWNEMHDSLMNWIGSLTLDDD